MSLEREVLPPVARAARGRADPNRSMLHARAIAEELLRSGVAHVAVAPGSRSGPLAIAVARAFGGERTSVHVDERCAAFFALGAARASGRPAAVLCTSGTAVANLLPAAIEADRARVPLVLLTADRPPEARGCGAAQTIDQARLFGTAVRACVDLPVAEVAGPVLRAVRAAVDRAVAAARAPLAGPVHVNAPFREPLDPREVPADVEAIAALAESDPLALDGREGAPFAPSIAISAACASLEAGLRARILAARRPLVVAGPEAGSGCLALAAALGAPVLVDALALLRAGRRPVTTAGEVRHHDAILRGDLVCSVLLPDLVLRAGRPPVSKALARLLERCPDHVALDDGGRDEDPLHVGATHVRTSPEALAVALFDPAARASPERISYLARWRRADDAARASLASEAPFFEAHVVAALERALPPEAILFAGNSMPVRDVDSFLGAGCAARVLANRGASGIDGVVSTALGACDASNRPGALLVGDLSALHDGMGLLAARRRAIPLAVVVVQNDGGAIFDHLPARASTPRAEFEALFTTPHGVSLAPLASLFGLPYHAVDGCAPGASAAFAAALESALAAPTASLVEVRLPRERSARLRRAALEAAARAAERAIAAPVEEEVRP